MRRVSCTIPFGGPACVALGLAILAGGCGSSGPSALATDASPAKSRFERLQKVGEAHKKNLQEKARAGLIRRR